MNVWSPALLGSATKWNTASSPVGTLPPVHVADWMSAVSPDPVAFTSRVQPGAASNESTPNPLGKSTSTLAVVSFSSSVGTATVNSWPCCFTTVGGLTLAWPNAEAGSASAPATRSAPAARQVIPAMTD